MAAVFTTLTNPDRKLLLRTKPPIKEPEPDNPEPIEEPEDPEESDTDEIPEQPPTSPE